MKDEIQVTFIKLNRNDTIPYGAFHSLDNGKTLKPILNPDTINSKVNEFKEDRSFWVMKTEYV